MPGDMAISRGVLADQVKDHILQAILDGRYPPRSRIVETRIARELGTSQAPVREALRGLEALGVVEILPFRGARVRHPTTAELLEAYSVRSSLEALGARLAMPRITAADVAELEALGHEMQAAAAAGDRHAVATADASFHARLIAVAANSTLDRVWRSLEPFSRTYITLVARGADPQWTADLHVPILAALRQNDAEQVVTALKRHFALAGEHLREGWDEPGDADDAGPAVGAAGSGAGRRA
jgi:DNA-binding GntR family transcriptional regulator